MGNPLNYRDGMSFTWENGRILKSIATSDDTVTMQYNSNGMRTRQDNSDYTIHYYYDSNNNMTGLNFGGNMLYFYYNSNGSATSFKYCNDMYYYVKDLQGDIVKIIDESGNTKVTYTYDAWGKVLSQTDTSIYNLANLNPFRYRGYVYDTETGLYYLQSRYYDPITGRFLNADSYADTGNSVLSTNMFAYCENNCANAVDYNGMDAVLLFKKDGAVIFGHAAILFYYQKNWYYFSVSNKSSNSKMVIDFGKIKSFTLSMNSINIAINGSKTKFVIAGKYTSYYYISGKFSKIYSKANSYKKYPPKYNLVSNNCLKVASLLLSKGTCSGAYKKYYQDAITLLKSMTIPNNANYAFYYFTKNVKTYYKLPWYKIIFVKDPYYYFTHQIS